MELKIMIKLYFTIILMTGLMFSTAQLQASDLYYGFKLAYFEMDKIVVDDPDNAGLVIGYEWDNDYGSLGLEGEFTTTFEAGKTASENEMSGHSMNCTPIAPNLRDLPWKKLLYSIILR